VVADFYFYFCKYFKRAPSQPNQGRQRRAALDNVLAGGSDVDIEKIPTPVWPEQDGGAI